MLLSVLIVDDTEFMRFIMREIMSDMAIGMIAEAGDKDEAIALAEALQPDIAVVDFTDPNLEAPDIVRSLHKVGNELPVVAITHLDDTAQIREATAAGACAQIVKPFDPSAVKSVLQDILEAVPVS